MNPEKPGADTIKIRYRHNAIPEKTDADPIQPHMTPLRRLLRYALPAVILLAGLSACRNLNRPAPEQSSAGKGQIIAVTDSMLVHGGTDTIRFGRLGSGEIAVKQLRLENQTRKPLVIVTTRRSCGCTSLDYEAQPVPPGEMRRMEMTFDSRGEFGWQLKQMEILFGGAKGSLKLFVEADVH